MAVMAPAGLAIAVWLACGKSWRLALQWCVLFGAGMALVVLTKVAFIGWGIGVRSVEFAGISGHAMRSAAIFPVLCFLLLKNVHPDWRRAGVCAGVALAVLISIARVKGHAHSSSEAISGTLLGLLVAGAFIWQMAAVRELFVSRTLVALSLCGLLLTPAAEPVPTEQWMTQLALYLSGHERPFQRSDWKVAERHPLLR
ncbi:phosphatase PAP2 family protein [Janthinobacterium sp.]|uniref:phosphatase PAP2 family protein n=1 Tax=Janthinobacterium sp. TaxID=1871054 RepID=UPI00293D3E80|nr:phosphatase PAP2 family protein [Janthinobacterium sp.]